MAAARPRTGRALVKDDANEERDIWKGLLSDGKKVDALVVCVFSITTFLIHLILSRRK